MKLLSNRDIKQLFLELAAVMGAFLLLCQLILLVFRDKSMPYLTILSLAALMGVLASCYWHFHRQNKLLEEAQAQISAYLSGDTSARVPCDSEGELYKLFHEINTLASVLGNQAQKELQAKEFLKNTISDISHQLKTPLAALNIYNGLLRDETLELAEIKEFASLSEQELDRIETLVQNLLTITRLDAGSIMIEKAYENLEDMMRDIELSFAYRARLEQKKISLLGAADTEIFCDRGWMLEAMGNLVKNALDHTKAGCHIQIEWKRLAAVTQISVRDNGDGIHPEDIHHIFKRFYRSRFSKDTRGLGLGLPLVKAIIEAHGGSVLAESTLGQGSTFTVSFLNTAK